MTHDIKHISKPSKNNRRKIKLNLKKIRRKAIKGYYIGFCNSYEIFVLITL